MIKSKKIDSFF